MKRRPGLPRELPILALLLVLFGAMAVFVPAFRQWSNLTALGEAAALIGILACGEGLVILSGGLDLSVGSIMALAGCVAGAAFAAGTAWPLAALLGLAAGALAGTINGALITDSLPLSLLGALLPPVRQWDSQRAARRVPRPPILITLATLLLFRYGVSILTQSKSYDVIPKTFYLLGQGWTPFLFFVLVVAFFAFTTLRTHSGRWAIALGGGEQAVRLSGISTEAVKRWTYLLSGLCAGLTGLLTVAFNNHAQSEMGKGAELDAIAACVVGGVRITGGDGSIFGVALGAVLIAILQNALVLTHRPQEQYGLFTGGIILAAAIIEQWRLLRLERKGAAA